MLYDHEIVTLISYDKRKIIDKVVACSITIYTLRVSKNKQSAVNYSKEFIIYVLKCSSNQHNFH